ncbi:MAG: hypothetical protein HYX57_01905 [Chloroflexi bacterium]|nr:hypothetical protein [Chloroflexota bacterium]
MAMDRDPKRLDLTSDERALVGRPGDLVSEDAVPPRPKASTVMVSLRIDRRTFDDIGRVAEERGASFSATARDALRAFISDHDDDRPYPEVGLSPVSRRVSETATLSWDDQALRTALDRYEAACRRAAMRDKAWRSYVDYARRFLAWREGDYRPRGTAAGDRPVPRTPVSANGLRDQAKQYAMQVQRAGREPSTVDTYFRHALFFVRWLDGQFEPGGRLRGLR